MVMTKALNDTLKDGNVDDILYSALPDINRSGG